jgi:hypothetical protein
MAKLIALHTISRLSEDGDSTQELPPGTVFEADGPELEDYRKAGAVADAADDEPLSDLAQFTRSDASLAEPATTLMPSKGPEEAPVADEDDEDAEDKET